MIRSRASRHLLFWSLVVAVLLALSAVALLSGPRTTERELTARQRDAIAHLETLGYLDAVEIAPPSSGVVKHDATETMPGVTLYSSGSLPEALLIDNDGTELHRWHLSEEDIAAAFGPQSPGPKPWRRVYLLPDGSMLAIFEGRAMLRVDRDSSIEWVSHHRFHHDAQPLADGRILTLTNRAHLVERVDPEQPILEDFVAFVDTATGALMAEYSVLEAFERSGRYAHMWRDRPRRDGDVLHTNSVELVRDASPFGADATGERVLLSIRSLDAIALMQLEPPEIVWAQTGSFRWQHDAHLLANGRVMLFDNRGLGDLSRVLEIDLNDGSEHVIYGGEQTPEFYTFCCGTAVVLPNGNILVTESGSGRVFELGRDREIVWEFINPQRSPHNGLIASVWDAIRYPPEYVEPWLRPGMRGHTTREASGSR